jgi:hypothetical protein
MVNIFKIFCIKSCYKRISLFWNVSGRDRNDYLCGRRHLRHSRSWTRRLGRQIRRAQKGNSD